MKRRAHVDLGDQSGPARGARILIHLSDRLKDLAATVLLMIAPPPARCTYQVRLERADGDLGADGRREDGPRGPRAHRVKEGQPESFCLEEACYQEAEKEDHGTTRIHTTFVCCLSRI
ncbi:hypothetical protein VPH35_075594 [Triticum aestivum]